jgi:putative oxidoreductase
MGGLESGATMRRLISIVLRLAIGGLFVYAGVLKVWDPASFAIDVYHYRILPYPMAVAWALYLPWLEIIAGACVIFNKWYVGALGILLALTAIFTVALAIAWARGLDISCGCFSSSSTTAHYPWDILRDLLIMGAILLLGWNDVFRDKFHDPWAAAPLRG